MFFDIFWLFDMLVDFEYLKLFWFLLWWKIIFIFVIFEIGVFKENCFVIDCDSLNVVFNLICFFLLYEIFEIVLKFVICFLCFIEVVIFFEIGVVNRNWLFNLLWLLSFIFEEIFWLLKFVEVWILKFLKVFFCEIDIWMFFIIGYFDFRIVDRVIFGIVLKEIFFLIFFFLLYFNLVLFLNVCLYLLWLSLKLILWIDGFFIKILMCILLLVLMVNLILDFWFFREYFVWLLKLRSFLLCLKESLFFW